MSTITSTTASTTTDCPSWCVEHVRPDDVVGGVIWGGNTLHMGPTVEGEGVEGEWAVSVSVDGLEPVAVDAYQAGQLTPPQARALAAALIAACEVAEATR